MRSALLPTFVLLSLVAPALAGCLGTPTGEERTPDVLASFYPLAYLAQRIGGDNITVGTLVAPGVEPHEWEPSLSDLTRISGSQVVLVQGLGFEPWLDNVKSSLPAGRDPFVVTTQNLTLREGAHDHAHDEEEVDHANETEEEHDAHANETEEEHEAHAGEGEVSEYDPHTWLDPGLYSRQAKTVEEALSARWPEHAPAFRERLATLQADLHELDEEYYRGLRDCELDFVIANHDAYGYLEARYGFEVESVTGLSPEAEPDAQTVARLIDLAREHNVTVIYTEELVEPRVAEVIAEEVGAKTLVLSPIEGLTPDAAARGEDYMSLMRANLQNLQEGMRCG